jgi:hypothetical protein
MGRSAKGRLAGQRAKAKPELKKVINRIWRRIGGAWQTLDLVCAASGRVPITPVFEISPRSGYGCIV